MRPCITVIHHKFKILNESIGSRLHKQRYDLADAVAISCDIPRAKLSVWRDDVQLQLRKAILHSFAAQSVSTVDHHTAGELFLEF